MWIFAVVLLRNRKLTFGKKMQGLLALKMGFAINSLVLALECPCVFMGYYTLEASKILKKSFPFPLLWW